MSIFRLLRLLFRLVSWFLEYRKSRETVKDAAASREAHSQAQTEMLQHYRRGEYEASLAKCEELKEDGEETASSLYFKGANLLYLGRLKEAERALEISSGMHGDA